MIATQKLRNFGSALGQWTALGAFVGVACGLASAAFLALLELVTDFRGSHDWIVYLLPLAGLGIGAIYERWGNSIKGGQQPRHRHAPRRRPADPAADGADGAHRDRAHPPVRRQRGPRRHGGADGRQRRRCDRPPVSGRSRPATDRDRRRHRRRLRLGVRDPDRRSHLRSRGGLYRAHRVRRAHAGARRGPRGRSGDARARHRAHRLPGRAGDPLFGRARRQARGHRRRDGAGDDRLHRIDPLHQGAHGATRATPPLPDVRGWRGHRRSVAPGRQQRLPGAWRPDDLARFSRSTASRPMRSPPRSFSRR